MENLKMYKDHARALWASGETINHNGKDYKMHKMSYGDYFLEPASCQCGEKDGFATDTIWAETCRTEQGQIYLIF